MTNCGCRAIQQYPILDQGPPVVRGNSKEEVIIFCPLHSQADRYKKEHDEAKEGCEVHTRVVDSLIKNLDCYRHALGSLLKYEKELEEVVKILTEYSRHHESILLGPTALLGSILDNMRLAHLPDDGATNLLEAHEKALNEIGKVCDRYREALEKYGRHTKACYYCWCDRPDNAHYPKGSHQQSDCTCGLYHVLTEGESNV